MRREQARGETAGAQPLNLRAGPGENFSIVGRIDRGTPVKEIRTEKSWMEIEAPAGLGEADAIALIGRVRELLGVAGEETPLSYLELILAKR